MAVYVTLRSARPSSSRAARDAAVVDRAADPRDAPPMIERIDARLELHVLPRPVACASPCSSAVDPLRRQRHRGHDFAPDDLRVLHQPVAIRAAMLREQRQPIALGEQHAAASRRSARPCRRAASSCVDDRRASAPTGRRDSPSTRPSVSWPATIRANCIEVAACLLNVRIP